MYLFSLKVKMKQVLSQFYLYDWDYKKGKLGWKDI